MIRIDELLPHPNGRGTDAAHPPPSGAGWARRLARRVALRAMKPHTMYQQGVNEKLAGAVSDLSAQTVAVDERLQMLEGRARASASLISALDARVGQLGAAQTSLLNEIEAFGDIAEAARDRPDMNELSLAPFHLETTGRVYGYREPTQHVSSSEGVGQRLLNIFAPSVPDAQARRQVYLEVLGDRVPVVDVGCGRGEFLDLLRDRGTTYVGVDPDPAMIAATRERGHSDVVESDGASYLESLPDASMGAMFCAQVIEHLPADYLIRLIALAHAKLKPGGMLILEAPNPHSPYTAKIFWVDITHRRPVFPEVALALCWTLGFESAYVFHPAGSGDVEADRYIEPEYAVVATKDRAATAGSDQ